MWSGFRPPKSFDGLERVFRAYVNPEGDRSRSVGIPTTRLARASVASGDLAGEKRVKAWLRSKGRADAAIVSLQRDFVSHHAEDADYDRN